jgi:F0F1-type ATP synthase assembly protein I
MAGATSDAEHMDTPSTAPVRRAILALVIGSFSIAALMGVVALLTGDFGETQGKVLLTTLVVGCASICVLCYLATGGTPYQFVGLLGGVAVVVPVVTAMMLIWRDWDAFDEPSEALLKSFGIGVVVAVTLAQMSMLLALAWARRNLTWLLWPTLALAVVLAALISSMILRESDTEGLWRVLGVVAILDVLGTVVTAALAKFGGRQDAPEAAARPAVPSSGLSIALPDTLAAAIEQRSRETGRSPAHLVAEAVERYLQGAA